MFGLNYQTTKVFIRTGPTDGRLAWEGLKALTVKVIGRDPMCGHLFVFCNAARNRIKMLWWDGSGFLLAVKRPRRGGFDFPKNKNAVSRMSLAQLELLLRGVEFTSMPTDDDDDDGGKKR